MPAPKPVVIQIRDYLVSAISGASPASGYNATLVGTTPQQLGNAYGDGTVIVDFGTDAITDDVMGNNLEEHIQEFILSVYIVKPETDPVDYDELRVIYAADIRKIINLDVTCGNLAHDTRPGPVEPWKRDDGSHEGLRATAHVRYRTTFGDPYTAR